MITAHLLQAKEGDFEKKVRGRWMIDRVKCGRVNRRYAFFTCPFCGGINKAAVSYADERGGGFWCIYCKVCRRNLSLMLVGFGSEWEKTNSKRTDYEKR